MTRALGRCAQGDIAAARKKLQEGGDPRQLKKDISTGEKVIHDAEAELVKLSAQGKYFTIIKEGLLTPHEFDHEMVDLINFLDYIGEPSKKERKRLGVFVLLFIAFFGVLAYFLKKEYWKDIH